MWLEAPARRRQMRVGEGMSAHDCGNLIQHEDFDDSGEKKEDDECDEAQPIENKSWKSSE